MRKITTDICKRLKELRLKHFGSRGKAPFAAELGIGPSSYQHYEIDRTPPAEILVLAAQLTGANLHWLLTGEGTMSAGSTENPAAAGRPAASDSLIARVENLLATRPELRRSLSGFLELLENVADVFPQVEAQSDEQPWSNSGLLPVVGSTAAGPARFWKELEQHRDGPTADARLEKLLIENSQQAVHEAEFVAPAYDLEGDGTVALVQMSQPDELGFVEFVACPSVRQKYPSAVCWRIDGDSMSPRYRDGDLVITCPNHPAIDGHPCIARQEGQIGVNCKIYHEEGVEILLIPVNELSSTQRLPKSDIRWAHRVLFSIRLSGSN